MTTRAKWESSYVSDLPDSSFLYIEPGGKKDKDGKTKPRSLRHLPYKDKGGKVDLPHLRNAISRLSQEATGKGWLSEGLRKKLLAKARRILASTPSKEGAEPMGTRAMSLDDRRDEIHTAWAIVSGNIPEQPSDTYAWIVEVFDTYVIVQTAGRFWKVGFSEQDGKTVFEDSSKWVEMKKRWVRRSVDEMCFELYVDDDETELYSYRMVASGASDDVADNDDIENDGIETPEALRSAKDADIDAERSVEPDGDEQADVCGVCERPVRALGESRVGEYLVLWGNPDRLDAYGTYFTKDTEELTAIFGSMGKIPMLYHHAANGTVKATVIGAIDIMAPDDVGLWVEGELNKSTKYKDAVRKLLQEEALFWSSGALPAAGKAAEDGWLTRWPIMEASLTPTPAEYRMIERPVSEIREHFRAVGVDFNLASEDGEDSASAELEIERERLALLALDDEF